LPCAFRTGACKQVIDLGQFRSEADWEAAGTYLYAWDGADPGWAGHWSQQRVDLILREGDSAEARFPALIVGMFMAKLSGCGESIRTRAVELNPEMPSVQSFYGQARTSDTDAGTGRFPGRVGG